MKVTTIPAVDPAIVRAKAGLNPAGSWYSPRQQRPTAYKLLDGNVSLDGAVRRERAL